MGRVILAKLAELLIGTNKRITRFLISVAILVFVAVLWRTNKEFVVIFLFAVFVYWLFAKCIFKKPEDKLEDIKHLLQLEKFEKALDKIEEVMTKDLSKVKKDKINSIYYTCIYYKATCLWHKAFTTGNTEYLRESAKLYEELLDFYFKENKNTDYIMSSIGFIYYNLGFLEDDQEVIKDAIKVLDISLDNERNTKETNISSIYLGLANCYQVLAKHSNSEEYLKKSLEELKNAYIQITRGKHPYEEAVLNVIRTSVLRKLNEINHNEEYKMQATKYLNDAIKYLNTRYNIYYRRYFPRRYITLRVYMSHVYFEMYKINGSEEDLSRFKEAVQEIEECMVKDNNAYSRKQIDEMLDELKLEVKK